MILAVLVSAAHTSPSDPTWMPGVGDNAPDDDVVILVTSEASLTVTALHREVDGLSVVSSSVRNFTTGILAAGPLRPDCPRAPPTA